MRQNVALPALSAILDLTPYRSGGTLQPDCGLTNNFVLQKNGTGGFYCLYASRKGIYDIFETLSYLTFRSFFQIIIYSE
ncbi:MAG: hypothetical protein LBF89_07250 [Bacteroidales bacterium]|jgi:hypothetical protein|nr:hypothetical protein [Bacteroidales bacterium]